MYHGHIMITHHGHTITEHVQTWSAMKNNTTMVNLLPGPIAYRAFQTQRPFWSKRRI